MEQITVEQPKSYSKSQRAEQLTLIRDLIVFAIRDGLTNRTHLVNAAKDKGILNRVDGKPFKYSSIYRYFDSFRYLHFDISHSYDINGDIEWSDNARELANSWNGQYGVPLLSESEKAIFRQQIFHSDAKEQFLRYFCSEYQVPESDEDFASSSHHLYILSQSVKRPIHIEKIDGEWPEEWPATKNVEISQSIASDNLVRKSQVEFLHTYRYWCLDSGIIDELNVREAERCGIPTTESYVIYPISDVPRSTSWFLEKITETFRSRRGNSQVAPIPWLMYKLCPTHKLSVEVFKKLLIATWKENRNLLHLERGPGGLIHNLKYLTEPISLKERYGNHRYYVIVDGTVRSNLVVIPSNGGLN